MDIRNPVARWWRPVLILSMALAASALLGRFSWTGMSSSRPSQGSPTAGACPGASLSRQHISTHGGPSSAGWGTCDVDGVCLGMSPSQAQRRFSHQDCPKREDEQVLAGSCDRPGPLSTGTRIMFRHRRVAWVHGHALHVRTGSARRSIRLGASREEVLRTLGPSDVADATTWEYRPRTPGQPTVQVDLADGVVESISLH